MKTKNLKKEIVIENIMYMLQDLYPENYLNKTFHETEKEVCKQTTEADLILLHDNLKTVITLKEKNHSTITPNWQKEIEAIY